jgi:deazaflavin-dependent oxidoreductase (nitroreductase family)
MAKPVPMPPKWILKAITSANVFIYRLSGGRLWNTLAGSPICLVTMTGRKSGRIMTRPLMYTPHGETVLIVASLGGAPQHPLWYHNIMAHPDIGITVGSVSRKMRARQASAAEKAELWPLVVASYPSFQSYQDSTTRDIPLLVCEPAEA